MIAQFVDSPSDPPLFGCISEPWWRSATVVVVFYKVVVCKFVLAISRACSTQAARLTSSELARQSCSSVRRDMKWSELSGRVWPSDQRRKIQKSVNRSLNTQLQILERVRVHDLPRVNNHKFSSVVCEWSCIASWRAGWLRVSVEVFLCESGVREMESQKW